MVAPRQTPNEVGETLSAAISSGLADPGLKQRFADLGADPFPATPGEFSV